MNRVRGFHLDIAASANAKFARDGFITPADHYESVPLTSVLNGPFFDDLNASDIPANQRIMPPSHWSNMTVSPFNQQITALTQFAFIGYPILFADRLGIAASDEDLWALNHLWAVLGYAIGLDDVYNIALQPDLATTRRFS